MSIPSLALVLLTWVPLGLLSSQVWAVGPEGNQDPLPAVGITPRRVPLHGSFEVKISGSHRSSLKDPLKIFLTATDGSDSREVPAQLITIKSSSQTLLILEVRVEEPARVGKQIVQVRVGNNVLGSVPLEIVSAGRFFLLALVPIVLLLVLAAAVGFRRTGTFNPLVFALSRSGRSYSLSKLQILLWTLIVGYLTAYVWLATKQMLIIEEQVLWLLGIASASSMTSKSLAVARQKKQRAYKLDSRRPHLADLFMQGSEVSLIRLQMLFFTVLVAGIVIHATIESLSFPQIHETYLWLMGISHGTYIADKVNAYIAAGGVSPFLAEAGPDEVATDEEKKGFSLRGVNLAGVKTVVLTRSEPSEKIVTISDPKPSEDGSRIPLDLTAVDDLPEGRYDVLVRDSQGHGDSLVSALTVKAAPEKEGEA